MESIYPVANESLDWYRYHHSSRKLRCTPLTAVCVSSLSGDDSSSLVEFADKYPGSASVLSLTIAACISSLPVAT